MNYYGYEINRNDLHHYGVLGMKWGVRKDPKKAYEKSSAKLRKYDKKYQSNSDKAQKHYSKAERHLSGVFIRKEAAQKEAGKGNEYMKNARVNLVKGSNWYKKMTKAFSKQDVVKFDQDIIDLGESMIKKAAEMNNQLYTAMLTNSVVDPRVYQMR